MSKRRHSPSKLALEAIRLYSGGQLSGAAEVARQALVLRPTDLEALNVLGLIEARTGRPEIGVLKLRRVVELMPSSPDAHYNLGCVLQQLKDLQAAERHYREAIRLNPKSATYLNNLGSLFQERKDIVKAKAAFEEARRVDQNHENTVINLCGVYRTLGAMADLELLTSSAVKAWPNNSLHWVARAEALFFLGRLSEAWQCYDWRFKASNVQHAAQPRSLPGLRAWNGEDLSQKSVLIWTEQGPGDEVMFATLVPEICKMVRRLTIRCSDRMQTLFARSFPDVVVFGERVPDDALVGVDMQASIVDFARVLRPNFESFRRAVVSLTPDRQKTEVLRQQYRGATKDLLVGIAWRSSRVQHAHDKTVDLGQWGPLFAVPGVRFVNLQYGDCSREIAGIKTEFGADVFHDSTINPLEDLDAHAAQIAAMDFVVCSSNTAAHFAGALGIETLCMVPATPGFGLRWSWFEVQGRSAWYPTARIWRQKEPGQWGDVIRSVTIEVARKVQSGGSTAEIGTFMLNLAAAYRAGNQHVDADAVLNALAEFPGDEALGLFELGRLAKESGDLDRALSLFDRALDKRPDWPALLNLSGVAAAAQGDLATAERRYRRALELSPEFFEVYNNLGTAVRRLGRGHEAHECYAKANDLQPNHPNILLNLATNLTELNRPQEAISYFDQLIALQPNNAEAHHNRSMALLTSGRLGEGWEEMRWRLQVNRDTVRPDEQALPLWAGQPLNGKSLLVWTEQGLGDEILTASMLPDAQALARSVTVVCAPRLVALFQRSFPAIRVCSREELARLALKDFDYQLSVSELGKAFRSSIAAFPPRRSFLTADPQNSAQLRERYKAGTTRPLIGLSWVSANPEIGALKSLTLDNIARALLLNAANIPALLSLQYGDHDEELLKASQLVGQPILADPGIDAITDFDGFAAQVAAMDLVVTISNTTAHLAGALGVPTILLLPNSRGRHWYWLRSCDVCPWYLSISYAFQDTDSTWNNALMVASNRLRELSIDPNQH